MEILFRGMPINEDRFCPFVYGFPVKNNIVYVNSFYAIVPVFEYTITQYVGQVDATGKKIFDGDILEFEYDGEKYLVEVFFNEKQSAFCIRDVGYSYCECIDFVKECKIVGNVFENPELLKKPIEGVKQEEYK